MPVHIQNCCGKKSCMLIHNSNQLPCVVEAVRSARCVVREQRGVVAQQYLRAMHNHCTTGGLEVAGNHLQPAPEPAASEVSMLS